MNASTSLESVPTKKKRKKYSASEKVRVLKAAEVAVASGARGALEALLRKERIYSSHLSAWRQKTPPQEPTLSPYASACSSSGSAAFCTSRVRTAHTSSKMR